MELPNITSRTTILWTHYPFMKAFHLSMYMYTILYNCHIGRKRYCIVVYVRLAVWGQSNYCEVLDEEQLMVPHVQLVPTNLHYRFQLSPQYSATCTLRVIFTTILHRYMYKYIHACNILMWIAVYMYLARALQSCSAIACGMYIYIESLIKYRDLYIAEEGMYFGILARLYKAVKMRYRLSKTPYYVYTCV